MVFPQDELGEEYLAKLGLSSSGLMGTRLDFVLRLMAVIPQFVAEKLGSTSDLRIPPVFKSMPHDFALGIEAGVAFQAATPRSHQTRY